MKYETADECFEEFAEKHGLELKVEPTTHNEHMDDGTEMDHFRCTLSLGDNLMFLTFSKGVGLRRATTDTHLKAARHGEDYPDQDGPFFHPRVVAEKNFNDLCEGVPPTMGEFLENALADSAIYEDTAGFEDFANCLGYDPDSRKAEKIYDTMGKQAREFKHVLGVLFSDITDLHLHLIEEGLV